MKRQKIEIAISRIALSGVAGGATLGAVIRKELTRALSAGARDNAGFAGGTALERQNLKSQLAAPLQQAVARMPGAGK